MKYSLLMIAFALAVLVGFLLLPASRTSAANVEWTHPFATANGPVLAESANVELQNSAASGAQTAAASYARRCASCHGKDGRAKTFKAKFNSARDLTDPQWHADVSDERIFNSITNGRGKMPAFGKKLPEAVIETLVAYIRGLKK